MLSSSLSSTLQPKGSGWFWQSSMASKSVHPRSVFCLQTLVAYNAVALSTVCNQKVLSDQSKLMYVPSC